MGRDAGMGEDGGRWAGGIVCRGRCGEMGAGINHEWGTNGEGWARMGTNGHEWGGMGGRGGMGGMGGRWREGWDCGRGFFGRLMIDEF